MNSKPKNSAKASWYVLMSLIKHWYKHFFYWLNRVFQGNLLKFLTVITLIVLQAYGYLVNICLIKTCLSDYHSKVNISIWKSNNYFPYVMLSNCFI